MTNLTQTETARYTDAIMDEEGGIMADKENQRRVNQAWKEQHTISFGVRLNRNTDADIIAKLEGAASRQGELKRLVRLGIKAEEQNNTNSMEEGKTMKHTICSIIKNDSDDERIVITWDEESGAMIDEESGEAIENACTCTTIEEARERAAWMWGDPVWGLTMAAWYFIERQTDGDEYDRELTAATKSEAIEEARRILGRMSQHDRDRQESMVALTVYDDATGVDLDHAYDLEVL